MARDTVGGTLLVAAVLCIVCSVLVSGAAVVLRPRQEAQKELDRQKNILIAAGICGPSATRDQVRAKFKNVEQVLVDLDTGKPVEPGKINAETYDPREAASKPRLSEPIVPADALPGINRREKYTFVYLVKKDGRLDKVVLPVYGNGLWSTLYGFLALEADLKTIAGITFYQEAETPGLGGEVENPKWKALWHGKEAFNGQGEVVIQVIKGTVPPNDPAADHTVDGLSGATITTRGVSTLVRYWLGPNGFGPYLDYLKGQTNTSTAADMSDGQSKT
jgi:Na+-transporting NADH:ubiquinone oxidoreductase subunit C